MPLNYNFAFKNSKLNKWERPAPKNIIGSRKTFKEIIISSYQILTKNPELFYPPGIIFILAFIVQLITIYPMQKVNKLESKHEEFVVLSKSLSNSESKIKSMKRYLKTTQDFYIRAMPSYLFAFYLQKSIPKGIQLNEYFVSDNEFNINANAYEIESLNEMITLLIDSPIINSNTLVIKEIVKQNFNDSKTMEIKIEGSILKLKPEKRKLLYNDSLAYGLSKKLNRFNYLEQFLLK